MLTRRRQLEKEKQLKVAQMGQEIQALVWQLQQLQARIVEENRSLSAKELIGPLDMNYIAHEKRYVGNLHVKIVLGMQKLAGIEKSMAAARGELLEAARARKVIEKLRERQLARWRADQERKEAAVLDEIGTQVALRGLAAIAHGETI